MSLLAPPASNDCRCLCGSLIARRVDGGVELKCRRCKRVVLVPWEEDEAGSDATAPSPPASGRIAELRHGDRK